MKKIILAIAAFAAMSISASATEVTGSILSTNIGTLIDGAPCKTYNVDGRTFVIAEDLRGYGFDVVYDDSIRRLTITQNPYSERTILSKEEINIEKKSITVGQWLGDMFATDITVYLGDEQIEGYAIDGQMVIPVRALEKCAYVEFDEEYKVVFVNGLQHYLTEQYNSGNPNITYNVTENTVNLFYTHLDQHGDIVMTDNSFSTEGTSKTTTATDTTNGSISAYWGKPYEIYPNFGRYQSGHLYNAANYTIRDKQGNLLYDIQISTSSSDYASNCLGYIRNPNTIITLGSYFVGNMYFFEALQEKDYYCYWPSESELAPEKVNLAGFTQDGKLLTYTGILCSLTSDNQLKAERYNISDSYNYYFLAKDSKVYNMDVTYSNFASEAASIFDECIMEDIKKFDFNSKLVLKKDGTLYHLRYSSYHNRYVIGEQLYSGIKDMSASYDLTRLAVINENSQLCFGNKNNYSNNTFELVDNDVMSTYVSSDIGYTVYYIKNSNELYSYSITTKQSTKLADNIRKIISSELFITTNDELTDLTNILATNVKDATDTRILTNDNTIIDLETGKQIFPKQ